MAKRKNLGKLALLGGAALLASRMMGKDKEGKKDKEMPTETGAGADSPRDRLGGIGLDRGDMDTSGDMSAGQARDRLADLERAGAGRTPTRTAPRTAPRGVASRANEIPPPMGPIVPRGRMEESLGQMGDVIGAKKGGMIKKMAKGGAVKSSASKRADGICKKGKTKGRMV
jgi:hypothetical protein